MKLNNNRAKVLQCLSPGLGKIENPLSAHLIRCRTKLRPLVLAKEIRALINLRWISTHGDGVYRITAAGKAALMESGKKEIQNGESRELFK